MYHHHELVDVTELKCVTKFVVQMQTLVGSSQGHKRNTHNTHKTVIVTMIMLFFHSVHIERKHGVRRNECIGGSD
jgi:hypothetical protein